MYRDLGYYWLRFAIYIALCLCVGTIFHDIGHGYGSIQVRHFAYIFLKTNELLDRQYSYLLGDMSEYNIFVFLRSLLNLQARGSMLMFVAAFLTFMAIGGFPSFVEDMKVCTFNYHPHLFYT